MLLGGKNRTEDVASGLLARSTLGDDFETKLQAGFRALGFDPSKDLRQEFMTFMFDDDAMKRSEAAVLDQLPRMIHAANRNGAGLAVEERFAGHCNDTPVTSDILTRQIVLLRDEGELTIVAPDGSKKRHLVANATKPSP